MIRPERLTIKAQEAFRDAGELARSRGNPVVNDAHLLAVLLTQDEGVVRPLLQKAGLNLTAVAEAVEREVGRFPTQSGGGAEPSFSREVQRIFDRADAETKKLGDQYISTEHLLLAMADEKGTTAAEYSHRPEHQSRRSAPRAAGCSGLAPGHRSVAGGEVSGPGEVHPQPDRRGPEGKARSGHRPGRGDPAGACRCCPGGRKTTRS